MSFERVQAPGFTIGTILCKYSQLQKGVQSEPKNAFLQASTQIWAAEVAGPAGRGGFFSPLRVFFNP